MSRPLVIIDSDIPFIQGVLETYCRIKYKKGGEIRADDVKEADALIIRTRTKCNEKLLGGSKIKALFTATIGEDHIDKEYCLINGIEVFNAAGCNASAVVQYVLSAIFSHYEQFGDKLFDKRIGIIGAGNVGEKLAEAAILLGFDVMRCDPPKKELDTLSDIIYYELDDLLKDCDILTLHLPLNQETIGSFSSSFFKKIRPGALFINSSRGEVVDEEALIESRNILGGMVIDVWRGEPLINRELLSVTDIATPHIAGYSLEGKANATKQIIKAFAKFYNVEQLFDFDIELDRAETLNYQPQKNSSKVSYINSLLKSRFNILAESEKLKKSPSDFEIIRNSYNYRREMTVKDIDAMVESLKRAD